VHADHLSRARRLSATLSISLYLPANNRVRYPFQAVADGDRISFGESWLQALHTPGHTWESTCYVLPNGALFTGDTLFTEGVGRPDLEATGDEARARAGALYRSLRRLLELPADTLVLPGHTAEPPAFDRRPVVASLGELAGRIDLLALEEPAFIEAVLARIPLPPPNHHRIVELNEAGAWPEDLEALLDLEAGANRCAVR
jgi:glyoxylase-like metal-dependent hydrolase (beta-lactamase superfamily II)